MSETLGGNETDHRLSDLSSMIDGLVETIEGQVDGSGNINQGASLVGDRGFKYQIGRSLRPDGQISYHARKEGPLQIDGFYETWEYYWGDCAPVASHHRLKDSRRYSGAFDPEEQHEVNALGLLDVEAVAEIVECYEMHLDRKAQG